MKRSWTHRHLLTRKFIAAAILCLFVLKGLSFLGMTASLAADPQGTSPVIASAVLGTHCENAQNKADPNHQHIDHAECCVFCEQLRCERGLREHEGKKRLLEEEDMHALGAGHCGVRAGLVEGL